MNNDYIKDFYDNMRTDVSDDKIAEIKENVFYNIYSSKKPTKKRRLKFSAILAAVLSVICLTAAVSGVMQLPSVQARVFNRDKNGITHSVKFSSSPVTVSDEVLEDLKNYIPTDEERMEKMNIDYGKYFDTYEEVEEYFGLKFLTNPMLGEPVKEIYIGDIKKELYPHNIIVNADSGVMSEDIARADIRSIHYAESNFVITYGIGILFEENLGSELGIAVYNEGMIKRSYPEIIQYFSETNPISCEIITYTETTKTLFSESEQLHRLFAYFTYDNLEYSIDASVLGSDYSMDECIEIMQIIIDSFETDIQ